MELCLISLAGRVYWQYALIAAASSLVAYAFERLQKRYLKYPSAKAFLFASLAGALLAIASLTFLNFQQLLSPMLITRSLTVALHCHMKFKETTKDWTLESSLDTKPADDKTSPSARHEAIRMLNNELIADGWAVAGNHSDLSARRKDTIPEKVGGWRLTHSLPTIHILKSVVTLRNDSELILDAPKGLVLETFPSANRTESMVSEDGFIRMYISLYSQYDPDEGAYLNMKTSSQTFWGRVGNFFKRFFSKAINWILAAILAGLAAVIAAWVKTLFKKKEKGTIIAGFPAGNKNERREPRTILTFLSRLFRRVKFEHPK